MAFSDEHVESIKRQAEQTLASLKLTPEEDEFARELASDLFDRATQAFVNIEGDRFERVRALASAAAVAYALITVNAWAAKTDKDFPPQQ